ncbi:MAG: glycosyltransferase family 4 protein [PVC group bacterium]|nr:glycosyltransferase family 4 protein [PVC group bacterium]
MKFLFPYMARWKAVNWTRYHQLFTRLARMGHDVYVLQPPASTDVRETNFQEIEVDLPEKLHLIDVDVNQALWRRTVPFNKLFKKGYYSFCCRRAVKKIVAEHEIDVLFLYNIPQYPLLNLCKCFKIFDYADDYREMLKHELGRFSNRLTLDIADFFIHSMISKVDLTLSVSHALADLIRHETAAVEVVPNGAEEDDFRLNEAEAPQIDCSKPVIGFVGSFEYFIDFDLIINTAQKMPEVTFLMVGSGRDFSMVKAEAEKRQLKNMIFTGAVPHSKIGYYIKEMDICLNVFKLIPVSHNACPLKLFEYLIMKKPVISNRLIEVEKINQDFIFFADTPEEMVQSINMVLANNTLAQEYAQRGYKITMKEYTWKNIIIKFLDLLGQYMQK